MFTSGNTSPCHHSLHLFAKTDESQQAGIVQKLSDRALREIIGTMIMMYLAVYKRLGYKVVFSPSSVILRRQFFCPDSRLDSIDDWFFTPHVIEKINGGSLFAEKSLSEPFEIIDKSLLVNNRFFNLNGSRIPTEIHDDYFSVRFRRIMMNLPVSTIKQIPSSTGVILPRKYRFKPNFDKVF
ncbi:hypothetical protein, partial [Gluconacetobacter diazotrophicus]|uniref:hypothetical protein n=1 Tax=Gluconacetobacter diazotrophicus TaxID=33996 RepID=UPI001C813DFF